MFPSKRISGLEQQIRDLTAQLTSANETSSGLQSQIEALTQQLAGTGMVTSDVHQGVVAERDRLQARVTELETTARTAGQQAADIVASVAVPPVAQEPAAAAVPTTPEGIVAHYKSLPARSQERTDFYQKHKHTIDHA